MSACCPAAVCFQLHKKKMNENYTYSTPIVKQNNPLFILVLQRPVINI